MATQPPQRLAWAVETVAAKPGDRVLEIGCGSGVALELLCAQTGRLKVVGIDRSTTAITAAKARLAKLMRAGSVELLNVGLADAELDESFDRIFAVNVNVFWMKPARELAVVRNALAAGGEFLLFYEPPSKAQVTRIRESCRGHLAAAGFKVVDAFTAGIGRGGGLCVVAKPAARTAARRMLPRGAGSTNPRIDRDTRRRKLQE